jgi:Ribbon-helix-helix protein, copG family
MAENPNEPGGMPTLSLRLPETTIAALDELAAERGVTRTRAVRQLLDAGLDGRPTVPSEPPTEAELVALLSERARAGNMSAIRSLLAREHLTDPRGRAAALFAILVEGRNS